MSSGLLGVEGGLIREGEEMPVSLLVLRSSRSLKLRRSEVCLKNPGLEESWGVRRSKTDTLEGDIGIKLLPSNLLCFYSDVSVIRYLSWCVRDRR